MDRNGTVIGGCVDFAIEVLFSVVDNQIQELLQLNNSNKEARVFEKPVKDTFFASGRAQGATLCLRRIVENSDLCDSQLSRVVARLNGLLEYDIDWTPAGHAIRELRDDLAKKLKKD